MHSVGAIIRTEREQPTENAKTFPFLSAFTGKENEGVAQECRAILKARTMPFLFFLFFNKLQQDNKRDAPIRHHYCAKDQPNAQ